MQWAPDDGLRLFFGITLAPQLQESVGRLEERLQQCRARVKWVEPHNLHLTLKFIGEVPARMVRDLKQVAGEVAAQSAPWRLCLHGVGAFPKLQRPQTIWVGTGEGEQPLAKLGTRLRAALEKAALAGAERKPFVAHCTIGRVRQHSGLDDLVAALREESDFATEPMTCQGFELLISELTRSGPIYTQVASFSFCGKSET